MGIQIWLWNKKKRVKIGRQLVENGRKFSWIGWRIDQKLAETVEIGGELVSKSAKIGDDQKNQMKSNQLG